MKYKDFIRMLKDLGLEPLRQNGSHEIWGRNGKHITVVKKGSKEMNAMICKRLLKEVSLWDAA